MRDLLPDIKQYSDYFTFQQDGAPAHRASETLELLNFSQSRDARLHSTKFVAIQQPRSKPRRLQNLGLKLLQERVHKASIKDVDKLRWRIAEEWDKLDQRVIDKAVAEWRKRLRACGLIFSG